MSRIGQNREAGAVAIAVPPVACGECFRTLERRQNHAEDERHA